MASPATQAPLGRRWPTLDPQAVDVDVHLEPISVLGRIRRRRRRIKPALLLRPVRLVTGASWVSVEAILERRVSDTTLAVPREEWITKESTIVRHALMRLTGSSGLTFPRWRSTGRCIRRRAEARELQNPTDQALNLDTVGGGRRQRHSLDGRSGANRTTRTVGTPGCYARVRLRRARSAG